MQKTTCYIYARKSSETEDRQALSLESQLIELRLLAQRHGLTVVKELTESMSAKEPGRPVFNRMIDDIERGEVDTILCWKLDRLSRNSIDQGKIQHFLQKGIIKRIIASDRTYLPEDNILMMNVELGMASQFITDLRKNVMRGNKTKLEKGWLPGKPPIGYLNDIHKRTIVIDPERFDKVRRLFQLFLTGAYTPVQLVQVAKNELQLTMPQKSLGVGRDFDRSYIYKMLRDPFYCGLIQRAGETYHGAHEPMITLVQHHQILAMMSPRLKSGAIQGVKRESFWLNGMIRCICGRLVTSYTVRKTSGKQYRYYSCSRKLCSPDGSKCHEKVIGEKELEKQALDLVMKVNLPTPLAEWIKQWARLGHQQEMFLNQLELETLNKERERLAKRLANLTTYLLDETLTRQDYERERPKLESELQDVLRRLEANTNRAKEWERAVRDALDLATLARTVYQKSDDPEIKRLILKALGSNFVLSQKQLTIELKKPFQVIANHQVELASEVESDLTRPFINFSLNQELPQTKTQSLSGPSLLWCIPDDSNV